MKKENKKEFMNSAEKCDFLQREYEYNRERKEGLLSRSESLFAWNAALFGFVIIFFRYDMFIEYIKYCMSENIVTLKTIVMINLLFIMVIGLTLCCISFLTLYISHKAHAINCFDVNDLHKKDFAYKEIIKDYIDIINDYDASCDKIAKDNDKGFYFMLVGFILTIIPLIGITIILYV